MYYVYILYSHKLNKKYIGFTEDSKNRLGEHNNGEGSVFTKKGRPWKLVYYQAFSNKKDAQTEELFLKTGQGRERLKYLLKNFLEENNK